ncbi:unnamed protein product [Camellia sinensis]
MLERYRMDASCYQHIENWQNRQKNNDELCVVAKVQPQSMAPVETRTYVEVLVPAIGGRCCQCRLWLVVECRSELRWLQIVASRFGNAALPTKIVPLDQRVMRSH